MSKQFVLFEFKFWLCVRNLGISEMCYLEYIYIKENA